MRTQITCLALGLILAMSAWGHAEPLDLKRYRPLSEVKAGMTGVGKTTLSGTSIVEFQAEVLAVMKNFQPKQDLIICRLSGAGLEESGVIAGMSGSPVYIGGRLIGAVAYSFRWSKLPIAGVQPIEQMLRVTDESPWTPAEEGTARSAGGALLGRSRTAWGGPAGDVATTALGALDEPLHPDSREASTMQPVRTPLMVSGVSPRAFERLREYLEPFGMVPMQGGAAELELPVPAKLEPGAPLAIGLVQGDVQMAAMGTITDVVGDRLYGFGHSLFGMGEANFPLWTGVAKVVIPSVMSSFRMGAPAKEVGRLVWDEETAVLGRLQDDRAPTIPVQVKVLGPGKGQERVFRSRVAQHHRYTSVYAATVASSALTSGSEFPFDHTVRYRVRVKPEGREAVVRDNITASPNGDVYVEATVRSLVGPMMENPFQRLKIEAVDVEATVEPVSRLAEIEKSRALRNSVRPGGTVPVELKIRPWRQEPKWVRVDVKVPEDYPEGKCSVVLCSADEALRAESREAPVRFQPDSVESLLKYLARECRRDQLFIRLPAPGKGLAVGRNELPNLPETMRAVLAGAARKKVTGVMGAIVTTQPMPYVLTGGRKLEITVDRQAPEG